MSTKNKYTSDFKKTIVNLYHSGKSYSQIHNEYGISTSALSKWIKLYSEVKIDDETVITAQQIKDLQKRNAQLEEENLILKKPLQYSLRTQATINCRILTHASLKTLFLLLLQTEVNQLELSFIPTVARNLLLSPLDIARMNLILFSRFQLKVIHMIMQLWSASSNI